MSTHPSTELLGPQTPIADIVLALNQLEQRPALLAAQELDNERLQALLEVPELRWASALLMELTRPERLPVLEQLAEDRMADLLQDLDHEDQEQILGRLTQRTRTSIMRLMHYPADTAGGIMTTEFLQVPMSWNVAQTLQHIREVESTRETVYAIYVVNDKQQLQFVVPLRKLVCADPQAALTELWSGDSPIAVQALTDKEAVAQLIRRHDFLAIPVVDEANAIIGIVTVDDVIDALMDEAAEDMNRFGGAEHIGKPYLQAGFSTMIRKRGGWLAILFLGEMLTASAMQYYEIQLEKAVVLAMFIPLIMSSGGNSGSQATSLLIRGLALGEVRVRDWWRVLLRELPVGLVLGTMLGGDRLYSYRNLATPGPVRLWRALLADCLHHLAGSGGHCDVRFLYWLHAALHLAARRFDPASASAPLVATLVDVLGLVIYFSVAAMLLTGTLL